MYNQDFSFKERPDQYQNRFGDYLDRVEFDLEKKKIVEKYASRDK